MHCKRIVIRVRNPYRCLLITNAFSQAALLPRTHFQLLCCNIWEKNPQMPVIRHVQATKDPETSRVSVYESTAHVGPSLPQPTACNVYTAKMSWQKAFRHPTILVIRNIYTFRVVDGHLQPQSALVRMGHG